MNTIATKIGPINAETSIYDHFKSANWVVYPTENQLVSLQGLSQTPGISEQRGKRSSVRFQGAFGKVSHKTTQISQRRAKKITM